MKDQDEQRDSVQEPSDHVNPELLRKELHDMIRFMKETCERQAKTSDAPRGPEDQAQELQLRRLTCRGDAEKSSDERRCLDV